VRELIITAGKPKKIPSSESTLGGSTKNSTRVASARSQNGQNG